MLNIRIPDDFYGKQGTSSPKKTPSAPKGKTLPASPKGKTSVSKGKTPPALPKGTFSDSNQSGNSFSFDTNQLSDSTQPEVDVNQIMAQLSNQIDSIKGDLSMAFESDSLRGIYDKIESNATLKSAATAYTGSNNFSIVSTIIKILLPSKGVVHTTSTITLIIMLLLQAILLFELFRIRSYCITNSNLTSLGSTVLICILLSGATVLLEVILFLYLIRTGDTYDEHDLRFFLNWHAILIIGLYGMLTSLSNSWASTKTLTAFMNSVSSSPNVIPTISASIGFTNSVNSLLLTLVLVTWFYLSSLNTFVLPFAQEYGSQAINSI